MHLCFICENLVRCTFHELCIFMHVCFTSFTVSPVRVEGDGGKQSWEPRRTPILSGRGSCATGCLVLPMRRQPQWLQTICFLREPGNAYMKFSIFRIWQRFYKNTAKTIQSTTRATFFPWQFRQLKWLFLEALSLTLCMILATFLETCFLLYEN